MKRCLYCYKELADDERDFHKSCSKKIFGTPQVPLLPYTRANIAELAREVIRSQTTLTGVQANWMPLISGSRYCSRGSRAMPTCTSKTFRCIAGIRVFMD